MRRCGSAIQADMVRPDARGTDMSDLSFFILAASVGCALTLIATASCAGTAEANPVVVPEGFEKVRPRIGDGSPLPRWFCSGFLHRLRDGRVLNVYHHQGHLEVS